MRHKLASFPVLLTALIATPTLAENWIVGASIPVRYDDGTEATPVRYYVDSDSFAVRPGNKVAFDWHQEGYMGQFTVQHALVDCTRKVWFFNVDTEPGSFSDAQKTGDAQIITLACNWLGSHR